MMIESQTRKSWQALIGADRFEVLLQPTDPNLSFDSRAFGGTTVPRNATFVLAHRGDELPDFLPLISAMHYGVIRRQDDGTPNFVIDFAGAIRMMKEGARVCRAGWNGKGMWIAMTPGSTFNAAAAKPGHAAFHRAEELGHDHHQNVTLLPHIDMRAADGSMVIGWLASQTDMLAEDWQVLGGDCDVQAKNWHVRDGEG